MSKITLSVKEVSELLGISITTVYDMVGKNEIPHFRVRSKILFNRNIIEDWTKGTYKHN